MIKKIYSRLFYKRQHPRYRIRYINFDKRIPVLHIIDKKCNDNFLLLTALEIITRENMIMYFSVNDVHRICYCLSQEYILLEKQQLLAMRESSCNDTPTADE